MRLRFFGRLRDAVGMDVSDVDLPTGIKTVEDARQWLGQTMPPLLERTVRIALDDQLAFASEALEDAQEMSFLPPVSGG